MSNNNDNSAATGIGIIGAGIIMVGFFLFAVVAFIAAIWSVLCLIALFTPLKLGKWTLEAEEARRFLLNGLIGFGMFPIFIFFCDSIFSLGVVWDYLPHMMGIGYVLGSVGWELLTANANKDQQAEVLPPEPTTAQPSNYPKSLPYNPQPDTTFRYASWDDEEELKK